jgi:RNA recognition motif-containing protein
MQNISGPGSPLHNFNDRDAISTPSRAYLDRVDVDNLSIFVGNLPRGITEHEIEELFGRYGTIDKITIKDVMSKYERELSRLR